MINALSEDALIAIVKGGFGTFVCNKLGRELNANEGIWEDLRVTKTRCARLGEGKAPMREMELLKVNREIDFNLTFACTGSFLLAVHA